MTVPPLSTRSYVATLVLPRTAAGNLTCYGANKSGPILVPFRSNVRRANRTARAQTQAERRQKSEQALLDAAAALIAERGVEQTSLARIGESAGTSRGLPTHHFGSKDALVARLARRSQDRVLAGDAERARAGRPTRREPLRARADPHHAVDLSGAVRAPDRRGARAHRDVGRDVPVAGVDRRHGGGGATELRRVGRPDLTRPGRRVDPARPRPRRARGGALRHDARRRRAAVDGVGDEGHEPRPGDVRRLDRRRTRASSGRTNLAHDPDASREGNGAPRRRAARAASRTRAVATASAAGTGGSPSPRTAAANAR